jgi:phosphatidate cytidylyltransferase
VNEKNRNLVVRVISAVILLPIIVYLLWRGGLWTAGLLAIAAGLCAGEYLHIVRKSLGPAQWVAVLVAALLPIFPAIAPGRAWLLAFWTVGGLFFFAWIFHLLKGPLAEAPTLAAHLITGALYGGLGLSALAALRLIPSGLDWVFCALIITWGNDTCAYFAGRALGRHKLYPAVSPNKTWEGFFGGMAGSIGGLLIAKATFFPALTVADCVIVGALGGVLGPMGDLCESMLKRAYGVKDSGRAIPGHGGMLDRIDALLFNAPMVFLYAIYLGHRL